MAPDAGIFRPLMQTRRAEHRAALLTAACTLSGALTLASVALVLVGRWFTIELRQECLGIVGVEHGRLSWSTPEGLAAPDGIPVALPWVPTVEVARRSFPEESISWGFGVDGEESETHSHVLPVWIPAVGFGGVAALLVGPCRRARRIAHHRCARCGYDLRGLASGSPCPECGRARA